MFVKALELPKQTVVAVKFGMACPHTFKGKATVSLQVLLSVTIKLVVKVPELRKVVLGAFVVLSIDPLLVKSHDQVVIEPVGVDISV
jgi:hypothetical protein